MDTKKRRMRHALRRFKERYGVYATEDDYHKMAKQIRTNTDAEFLFQQSNSRSVWSVHCSSLKADVIAVYNSSQNGISTFLPPQYDATGHFMLDHSNTGEGTLSSVNFINTSSQEDDKK